MKAKQNDFAGKLTKRTLSESVLSKRILADKFG